MHTVSEKQFMVRWLGYGPAGGRWVREENLNKGGALRHWTDYIEKFHEATLSRVWATVQIATEQQVMYGYTPKTKWSNSC